MQIERVPTDLMWTTDNGAHESIPIGKIIAEQHAALRAARPYVETCADDELPNVAAEVLKQIDSILEI